MHNRQDLINLSGDKIAQQTKLELTNADLTRIVNAVISSITELSYDDGLQLIGLGTFKMKRQAAKKGICAGKTWSSEEKDVLRFKASKRKV